jgi:hypothetical protein
MIDGARRDRIARRLGVSKLACVIHPPMEGGEREARRFEQQTTFKPPTQGEQARQRRRPRELGVMPAVGSNRSGETRSGRH